MFRALLSALVVMALTLSSFGHRSLSLSDAAQAEAFILAGGDWAELCGDSGDPLAATTKCQACLIAQSCAIPPQTVTKGQDRVGKTVNWPSAAGHTVVLAIYQSYPARAPPFA